MFGIGYGLWSKGGLHFGLLRTYMTAPEITQFYLLITTVKGGFAKWGLAIIIIIIIIIII